jgi:acyl carrier protein
MDLRGRVDEGVDSWRPAGCALLSTNQAVDNPSASLEREVTVIVSRVTRIPASRIQADTHLKNDLNVDSLQGLQILAAIEKRYGVTVEDDELDSYTSVREIACTVERLRSA